MQPPLVKNTQENIIMNLGANSSQNPKDHTKAGGGVERNRNKQPLLHKEEIKMKNPTMPNNPDTRRHKGWNRLEALWHASLVGTDKVKSGEQALPFPPKKPEDIQGTKLIMLLLWAWTVYLLCKIMIVIIKRRRVLKSNEAVNEMGGITPQTKRPITHSNKEELKEPIPNDDQGTIASGTTGTLTTASTDTTLGAGETQWVSTRQWEKLDGATNTIIGDIRKAIYDEFNDNVRRFMVNKYSGS